MDLEPLTGLVINNTTLITNSSSEISKETATMLIGYLLTIFFFILMVTIALSIGLYVFVSLSYMTIAKKTKTKDPWLAWIPIANLYLIAKIAKMSAWPLLLLLSFLFIPVMIIFPEPILILTVFAILFISIIILTVFTFIWHYKIYERREKPGWWIFLSLIPYAGGILHLVFLGIVAWNDEKYT